MRKQRIAVEKWGVKRLAEQHRAIQLELKSDGKSFRLKLKGDRKWKWECPSASTFDEFRSEATKWILNGARKYGFLMMPPIEWVDRDFIERLARALEKSKLVSDADMIFASEWEAGRFQNLRKEEIASRLSKTLGQRFTGDFVYKRYFDRGERPYSFKSGPQSKV